MESKRRKCTLQLLGSISTDASALPAVPSPSPPSPPSSLPLIIFSAYWVHTQMGHTKPLSDPILLCLFFSAYTHRWGTKPDGVCLVVGTMASGFPPERNTTGDVIATASDLDLARSLQYFWEAFPAGSGGPGDRTTYMFTYLDAEPYRPSLEEVMGDYWRLMPG